MIDVCPHRPDQKSTQFSFHYVWPIASSSFDKEPSSNGFGISLRAGSHLGAHARAAKSEYQMAKRFGGAESGEEARIK